jgi:hypothetical protein
MRGKHTVREISETLGRPQSSVSNLLHRPGRMEAARLRLTGAPQPASRLTKGSGASHKNAAPQGIRERFGITATPETVGRKSPAGATALSGASVPLEPMLIVPDAHRPFHSKVWWDLLMQAGRFLRPKHLIVIGDFADFYEVSKHPKDPERKHNLADELADLSRGRGADLLRQELL